MNEESIIKKEEKLILKVVGCNVKHFRKARKEYKCSICGRKIKKGDMYFIEYETGLFGRGFGKLFISERLCLGCAKKKRKCNAGGKIIISK